MRKSKNESSLEELANIRLKVGLFFEKSLGAIAKRMGLTFQQAQILSFLKETPPVIMTQLAKEFSLTPSGMTGLIDRLLKQKLVVREYDPKDRRIILIRITNKGKTKSELYKNKVNNLILKMVKSLSSGERKNLLRILKSIYKSHRHLFT